MACACGCCQRRMGSLCPSEVIRVRMVRLVRRPMVLVGELRGLIYRASRMPGDAPKTYVHFFKERLPTLATNMAGTRLYIVGGQYRVTPSGIHG
ncbi:hypothetical protein HYR99_16245 [Candidatus Poribacteria bacterium]|nr:hypothetical protein [Candidatus Poribacteria bacterium]